MIHLQHILYFHHAALFFRFGDTRLDSLSLIPGARKEASNMPQCTRERRVPKCPSLEHSEYDDIRKIGHSGSLREVLREYWRMHRRAMGKCTLQEHYSWRHESGACPQF